MNRILSNIKTTSPHGVRVVFTLLLLMLLSENLQAQKENIHFGVRGGIGMSTFRGIENNGLRLGVTLGVYGQYQLRANSGLATELYFSVNGQQSEKWTENEDGKVKVYSKYSMRYFNLPVLYQYYFTDILGIEAGLNFCYCVTGSLQTKIGNGSWQSQDFSSADYNSFDMGLILGIYTDNLIPHDNFFVSLRVYYGFLDVLKDAGSNKNLSVQASVGYMLF